MNIKNQIQDKIQNKVKSLRETVNIPYRRPEREKLDKMIEALSVNDTVLQYLNLGRGLSNDTIKHFQLGYDESKDAIAIPIFKTIEGKEELIDVKYRHLNPTKAKYSRERNTETWIYNEEGIHRGMKRGYVVIVEGEFDLMSAWQSGIRSIISPASGKDSYGVWIELLDNIPRVIVAYDNDEAGQSTAKKIAERLGVDKCFELQYPEGIKDANEYFKKHVFDDFKELMKTARPFYSYQFTGIGDIINSLRNVKTNIINTKFIPSVDIEKDWLLVVSGSTNAGKSSFVLNVADELANNKTPVLVMPFERGSESIGKRFMQIKFDKTLQDFQMADDEEWAKITEECIDTPIYFAVPKRDEIIETIIKAKKIFNTQVVIVDHLDYLVRHVSGNRESEIANTLQDLKRIAEEHKIVMLIVTHVRKIDSAGAEVKRKPNIEDLKGSSSLYQDPECVVMLHNDGEGYLNVNVLKNKGPMKEKTFKFKVETGKLEEDGLTSMEF